MAIVVAVIAAVASVISAWAVRQKPKDPATAHVERADKVVDLQAGEIERLIEALEEARLREVELLRHVASLRLEVLRLGGAPESL